MSERTEFLKRYAARKLGRDLTDSENDLVSKETSRAVVAKLCSTFKAPKPKKVEKKKESVVDEVKGTGSKGTKE